MLALSHLFLYIALIPTFVCASSSYSQFRHLQSCLLNFGVSKNLILGRETTPIAYAKVNAQWNIRGCTVHPLAYLLPESPEDIQKAVICGRRLNVRVVPKSGGHGMIKYAYGDSNSLVVDLRNMAEVYADTEERTVTVGAGARQGKLAYCIWEQAGFAATTGICPSVGVAGYALGGGQAELVREFGLMSDNVLEVEMVDAEGRLLIANSEVNQELYWALRGGGGGNFGIVTRLKIKAYEAPNAVINCTLTYDFNSKFEAVFAAYQEYVQSNVTLFGAIRMLDGTDSFLLELTEMKYEGRAIQMDHVLSKFPIAEKSACYIDSYPTFLLNTALNEDRATSVKPNVNVTKPEDLVLIGDLVGKEYYRKKSFFVKKFIGKCCIRKLFRLVKRLLPVSLLTFEAFGGAANNYVSEDTAFVHRGQLLYLVSIRYSGEEESPIWIEEANRFFEDSKSIFKHNESYQNYIDDDMSDYLERYYGSNLERLISVKTAVDPDNFFRHPQSIPTYNLY